MLQVEKQTEVIVKKKEKIIVGNVISHFNKTSIRITLKKTFSFQSKIFRKTEYIS